MEKAPALEELAEAAKSAPSRNVGKVTQEVIDLAKPALRRAFGTYGARSAGIVAAPLLAIAARNQLGFGSKD